MRVIAHSVFLKRRDYIYTHTFYNMYTIHTIIHTIYYTIHTLYYILYYTHTILYTILYTHYTIYYTLYYILYYTHTILYTILYTHYTIYYTIHTLYYILYYTHTILYTILYTHTIHTLYLSQWLVLLLQHPHTLPQSLHLFSQLSVALLEGSVLYAMSIIAVSMTTTTIIHNQLLRLEVHYQFILL